MIFYQYSHYPDGRWSLEDEQVATDTWLLKEAVQQDMPRGPDYAHQKVNPLGTAPDPLTRGEVRNSTHLLPREGPKLRFCSPALSPGDKDLPMLTRIISNQIKCSFYMIEYYFVMKHFI